MYLFVAMCQEETLYMRIVKGLSFKLGKLRQSFDFLWFVQLIGGRGRCVWLGDVAAISAEHFHFHSSQCLIAANK